MMKLVARKLNMPKGHMAQRDWPPYSEPKSSSEAHLFPYMLKHTSLCTKTHTHNLNTDKFASLPIWVEEISASLREGAGKTTCSCAL